MTVDDFLNKLWLAALCYHAMGYLEEHFNREEVNKMTVDTHALKDMVHLVLVGVGVIADAEKDGHIGVEDLGLLLRLVPAVGPAAADAAQIPAEFSALDPAAAADLVAFVMAELTISDAHAKLVIQKSLYVISQVYGLVKTIQNPAAV